MKIGKADTDLLEKIITGGIKRSEILVEPNIGEDCAVVELGDELCVLSTDPITGATEDLGRLAVNINANDIASSGAEPIGIMVTILLPPKSSEEELKRIMREIYECAEEVGIAVLGGHTEVTDAVNRVVVSCTVIGKTKGRRFISSAGAKAGDDVLMTKWAGVEGTAIIALEYENELKGKIKNDFIERAKTLSESLSVIKEGEIAAEFGVNSMHDVTEGGILGACYEVSFCSKTGIEVYIDKIPLLEETKAICDFYDINPYRLISSGCMLICCENGRGLKNLLEENGVRASVIGKITENKERVVIQDGERMELTPPESDELYKVVGN